MNKDQLIAEFSEGDGMQQTCAILVEAGLAELLRDALKHAIQDGIPISQVYSGVLRATYAMLTARPATLDEPQRALFALLLVDVGTKELEHATKMLLKGRKS